MPVFNSQMGDPLYRWIDGPARRTPADRNSVFTAEEVYDIDAIRDDVRPQPKKKRPKPREIPGDFGLGDCDEHVIRDCALSECNLGAVEPIGIGLDTGTLGYGTGGRCVRQCCRDASNGLIFNCGPCGMLA